MRKLLQLALSASVIGAPLWAQTSADFGPLAGYYRPYGHFDPAAIQSTALPQAPSDLSGVAWGIDGHLSVGRWGVGGVVSTASSTIRGCACPGGFVLPPTNARVTMGLAEARYDVSPSPARFHVWVGAGPALVQHGGNAYASYGNPRSWGAAVGIEFAAALASHFQIVANATSVQYSLNVNPGSAQSLERGAQSDALLYLGLRWHRP